MCYVGSELASEMLAVWMFYSSKMKFFDQIKDIHQSTRSSLGRKNRCEEEEEKGGVITGD